MSDTPKPEQIQANVAAALSRLRGDVMPPITSSSGGAGAPGNGGAGGGQGNGNAGSGGAAAASGAQAHAAPNAAAASSEPVQSHANAAQTGSSQPGSTQPGSSQAGSPQSSPSQPSPAQSASATGATANPAGAPSYFAGGLRADPSFGLGNGASTMSTSGMTPSGPSAASGSLRPSTATGSSYFGNVKPPLSAGNGGASGASQPDLLSGVDMGSPPLGGAYPASDDDKGAAKRKRNRLLVLGGAVAALVVIGAIWLGSGDSGQAPVITADTSPEKVKPTDAGGLQVPNQNVQVLENMNGQAPQQSGETVLPPPEQPMAPPAPPAVTDTDAAAQANGQAANGQPANGQPANGQPATGEQVGQQAGLAAPSVPAVPDAPAVPSVPAAPDAASPAMSAQAPATPADNATANGSSAATAADAAKPAATQAAAKPAEASKTTTQPTATAGGKVKIQLAAVKSEAAAKSEWAKLQKAHPGQLGKLNLIVQKFSKDGTVYYRVQAGPLADRTAAKSICGELAKQKQACIIAR